MPSFLQLREVRTFQFTFAIAVTQRPFGFVGDSRWYRQFRPICPVHKNTRIRRIQRLKGYAPLEDTSGLPPCSPPRRMLIRHKRVASRQMPNTTPKSRTVHVSPDDGRMESEAILFGTENIHSPFFDGQFQLHLKLTKATKEIPAISVGDEESDNDLDLEQSHVTGVIGHSRDFDSMLEDLDLHLIDLRRPHRVEYGDDECSLGRENVM